LALVAYSLLSGRTGDVNVTADEPRLVIGHFSLWRLFGWVAFVAAVLSVTLVLPPPVSGRLYSNPLFIWTATALCILCEVVLLTLICRIAFNGRAAIYAGGGRLRWVILFSTVSVPLGEIETVVWSGLGILRLELRGGGTRRIAAGWLREPKEEVVSRIQRAAGLRST
jgi:hypothetical protein